MILTKNQQRDVCIGNKDVPSCNKDNYKTQCIKGQYSAKSQGILTGNCCNGTIDGYTCKNYTGTPNTCEVMSWCPTEDDSTKVAQVCVRIAFITYDL